MRASSLTFLAAGSCRQREFLSIRGGAFKKVDFPALCTVIDLPGIRPIVYDTGYGLHYGPPKGLAVRLYSLMLRPAVTAEQLLAAQLPRHSIDPSGEIDIVLSHFHPDHIGGCREFTKARIFCFREAYKAVADSSFPRLAHGFFSEMLPPMFSEKAQFVDSVEPSVQDRIPVDYFGKGYLVNGDDRLVAYKLHGHARAQMGLLVRGKKRTAFLVADAAWSSEAIRSNRLPSSLARIAQDDWAAAKATLGKLHLLQKENPDWVFVPSHCREMEKLGSLSL